MPIVAADNLLADFATILAWHHPQADRKLGTGRRPGPSGAISLCLAWWRRCCRPPALLPASCVIPARGTNRPTPSRGNLALRPAAPLFCGCHLVVGARSPTLAY